jgi:hypothetical protein
MGPTHHHPPQTPMATRQQLEDQLGRCEEAILDTIRSKLNAELTYNSELFQRTTARLHALQVLEKQLHAAWRRTPR